MPLYRVIVYILDSENRSPDSDAAPAVTSLFLQRRTFWPDATKTSTRRIPKDRVPFVSLSRGTPCKTSVITDPSTSNHAVEGGVPNFTLFVFNYTSSELEKSEQFAITGNHYMAQINNLSTGTEKRVIAYVNIPIDAAKPPTP